MMNLDKTNQNEHYQINSNIDSIRKEATNNRGNLIDVGRKGNNNKNKKSKNNDHVQCMKRDKSLMDDLKEKSNYLSDNNTIVTDCESVNNRVFDKSSVGRTHFNYPSDNNTIATDCESLKEKSKYCKLEVDDTAIESIIKRKDKNDQRKKVMKLFTQNIRGASSTEKQALILEKIKHSNRDFYAFTETSLSLRNENNFIHELKKYGRIFVSSKKDNNRGNGILVLVKYPIASNVIKYRMVEGRILNLIVRIKKHKEISIYFIQAPTAPYREGAQERSYLKSKL